MRFLLLPTTALLASLFLSAPARACDPTLALGLGLDCGVAAAPVVRSRTVIRAPLLAPVVRAPVVRSRVVVRAPIVRAPVRIAARAPIVRSRVVVRAPRSLLGLRVGVGRGLPLRGRALGVGVRRGFGRPGIGRGVGRGVGRGPLGGLGRGVGRGRR